MTKKPKRPKQHKKLNDFSNDSLMQPALQECKNIRHRISETFVLNLNNMEVLFASKNLPPIAYMQTLDYIMPKTINKDLDQAIKRASIFNDLLDMLKTGTENVGDYCETHNGLEDTVEYHGVSRVADFESLLYDKYYDHRDLRKAHISYIEDLLDNDKEFLFSKRFSIPSVEYIYVQTKQKYEKSNVVQNVCTIESILLDTLNILDEISENEALDDMNQEYLQWAHDNPDEAMAERYDYLV